MCSSLCLSLSPRNPACGAGTRGAWAGAWAGLHKCKTAKILSCSQLPPSKTPVPREEFHYFKLWVRMDYGVLICSMHTYSHTKSSKICEGQNWNKNKKKLLWLTNERFLLVWGSFSVQAVPPFRLLLQGGMGQNQHQKMMLTDKGWVF